MELSFKQLVIQSSLISLGQKMRCVLKTHVNVVSSNVRYFLYSERVIQVSV